MVVCVIYFIEYWKGSRRIKDGLRVFGLLNGL